MNPHWGRQHSPALGMGGCLVSVVRVRKWLPSLPAWQCCDLRLSSAHSALGSIGEKAAYVLGRMGGAGRAPLPSEGCCLLSGAWWGLVQRQVAKEIVSLKVTAEEPPIRGALHGPGSPAELSNVLSPCPQGLGGKGSSGSTACPSQMSRVAFLHWGSKGRVGGCELGDVSPSGAFFFVCFFVPFFF